MYRLVRTATNCTDSHFCFLVVKHRNKNRPKFKLIPATISTVYVENAPVCTKNNRLACITDLNKCLHNIFVAFAKCWNRKWCEAKIQVRSSMGLSDDNEVMI